jgi:hypothetical protein
MSNTKPLNELLDDLRAQIEAMDTEDDRVGHLRSLVHELQSTNESSINSQIPASMEERLGVSIFQFQGSHPRIAIVLNELLEKLNAMGI